MDTKQNRRSGTLDEKQRSWLGEDGVTPEKVLRMLTSESDLRLVLRMMEANQAPRGAVMALYRTFARCDREDFLIRVAVAMEVQASRSEAMILRGENTLSRIALAATESYEKSVGPAIDAIVSEYLESPDVPIAPSPDHETVKKISAKITAAAMLQSPPREYRAFISSLLTNVSGKFPEKHLRVCAGHLFLRVLCPRILRARKDIAEEEEAKEPQKENERKQKLILSKAVQAIFLPSSAKPSPPSTQPPRDDLHGYLVKIMEEEAERELNSRPRASSINSAENGSEGGSADKKVQVQFEWGKDSETFASYLESLKAKPDATAVPQDTVIKVVTGQMKQMLGIQMPDAELQHKIYFGGIVVGLLTLFVLRSWMTLRFQH